MNLNEKIDRSIDNIDKLLNEEVNVFFVNVIGGNILINDNNLPSISFKKGELTTNIIKEKLEYFMGTTVTNINCINIIDDSRYYTFDFEDKNILSTYKYIPITELKDVELLKKIKDVLD